MKYESCSACNGSGLALNGAGEPDECRECSGNTVVPASPEVSELVERLKTLNPWTDLDWPERIQEAADALASLSLQLAAVEKERANAWKDYTKYLRLYDDEKARAETAEASLTLAQEENERLRALLTTAAEAGWNACRRQVYLLSEDYTERSYPLKSTDDVAGNFYRGQYDVAKSFAKAFNAFEALDCSYFKQIDFATLSTPSKGKDKTDAE